MAETKSADLIARIVERNNDFAIQRPFEGMDRDQVAAANIASHDFGINAFGITTFPARATDGKSMSVIGANVREGVVGTASSSSGRLEEIAREKPARSQNKNAAPSKRKRRSV